MDFLLWHYWLDLAAEESSFKLFYIICNFENPFIALSVCLIKLRTGQGKTKTFKHQSKYVSRST